MERDPVLSQETLRNEATRELNAFTQQLLAKYGKETTQFALKQAMESIVGQSTAETHHTNEPDQATPEAITSAEMQKLVELLNRPGLPMHATLIIRGPRGANGTREFEETGVTHRGYNEFHTAFDARDEQSQLIHQTLIDAFSLTQVRFQYTDNKDKINIVIIRDSKIGVPIVAIGGSVQESDEWSRKGGFATAFPVPETQVKDIVTALQTNTDEALKQILQKVAPAASRFNTPDLSQGVAVFQASVPPDREIRHINERLLQQIS